MLVYLALGSNLGDREAYLEAALRGLTRRGMEIVKRAPIYSTEPKEITDQPWFLNTAVSANTPLDPGRLLAACLEIEAESGRTRAGSKGPRTLDIDIIFYGNLIISEPGLIVPHPRFAERRFVLMPLVDLAPEFVDPVSGKTIRRLLSDCADESAVFRQSAL